MADTSSSVIPAHLNASDFTLYNSTPEMIAQLQLSLDVTQARDPAGTAILRAAWLNGGRLVFNPFTPPSAETLAKLTPEMREQLTDGQGKDFWDPVTHAVYWNPYSALQVDDINGNLIGVQSPRVALVHESTHGIDDLLKTHILDIIPQWHNSAEYLAMAYEGMSGAATGDPVRDHYGSYPVGQEVEVTNSTMHTGMDAFGQPVWVQTNQFGVVETGPRYDFVKIKPIWFDPAIPPDMGRAPVFGSTIPPGDWHDGDDSGYFNDGDYHVGTKAPDVTYTDQGMIVYNENGEPWVFHNPPEPDPSTIIILDPQNGPGNPANGGEGGGAWESDWTDSGGSETSDEDACPACESYLPDDRQAGDVVPDDTLRVVDPRTLARSTGRVSYSERKLVPGSLIVTESGAWFKCSDTAKMPIKGGELMTPDRLVDQLLDILRISKDGTETPSVERVMTVEKIGMIWVQHITCENQCFLVGGQRGVFFSHHNQKQARGGSSGDGDGAAETSADSAQIIGIHHLEPGILM